MAETTTSPDAELFVTEPADSNWGEPVYIGDFDVLSIVGVAPGGQSLLVVEQTGEAVEGCEGGMTPAGRLSLIDLDTATSRAVAPNFDATHSRLHLGPQNRVASIASCDANAWLEAVGTLDTAGNLVLEEVGDEPGKRVTAGNNAGVSVTWTADGEVLFVNFTRVDAGTGERLGLSEGEPALWTFAELEDGTRLVSEQSQNPTSRFWVVESDARSSEATATTPDFAAQASYPTVQVQISATGDRAFATFENWDDNTVWTAIVDEDGVQRINGRAWPSPSGSHLLISETGGTVGTSLTNWTVVDLDAGTRSTVLFPAAQTEQWVNIMWGATDDELLISVDYRQHEASSPTTIWRLSKL